MGFVAQYHLQVRQLLDSSRPGRGRVQESGCYLLCGGPISREHFYALKDPRVETSVEGGPPGDLVHPCCGPATNAETLHGSVDALRELVRILPSSLQLAEDSDSHLDATLASASRKPHH